RGEGAELVHHGVDRVIELQDLAPHVHGDLLGQVAVGDRDRHRGDVAHLGGEVAGHEVQAVRQVLPGAREAFHLGLAAEAPSGAPNSFHQRRPAQPPSSLFPYTTLFRSRGEGAELVHHGVDRVLQLQDLAPHVDGDLLGEVAVGDGGGDVGDVADLAGEVAGHGVDGVGQVLPRAGHALHVRLAAELALRTHLAGHPRHLGGEARELVDHGVDGGLQLHYLALDVVGDLLGEVAAGDGGGDVGDVAHLAREVAGHRVDVVGQVLPGPGHAGHLGLAAELPFRADLARHARDLGR